MDMVQLFEGSFAQKDSNFKNIQGYYSVCTSVIFRTLFYKIYQEMETQQKSVTVQSNSRLFFFYYTNNPWSFSLPKNKTKQNKTISLISVKRSKFSPVFSSTSLLIEYELISYD